MSQLNKYHSTSRNSYEMMIMMMMSTKHDDGGPLELAQQAYLFASILYTKGADLDQGSL